jgi:hypothetical protein
MSRLKFEPEMFALSFIETEYKRNEMAAQTAQKAFDDWLEEQTVVYICDHELKTLHFVEPVDATHTARLVCIEEIKPKECEHIPIERLDYRIECLNCGCELKATWGKV